MKFEDLEKLEEGTLLRIEGNGVFGKVDRLITHKAANLIKPGQRGNRNNGYKVGCTLCPLEWVKLATKKDVDSAIQKLTEEYHQNVNRLEDAFQKAQNARERLKR